MTVLLCPLDRATSSVRSSAVCPSSSSGTRPPRPRSSRSLAPSSSSSTSPCSGRSSSCTSSRFSVSRWRGKSRWEGENRKKRLLINSCELVNWVWLQVWKDLASLDAIDVKLTILFTSFRSTWFATATFPSPGASRSSVARTMLGRAPLQLLRRPSRRHPKTPDHLQLDWNSIRSIGLSIPWIAMVTWLRKVPFYEVADLVLVDVVDPRPPKVHSFPARSPSLLARSKK